MFICASHKLLYINGIESYHAHMAYTCVNFDLHMYDLVYSNIYNIHK